MTILVGPLLRARVRASGADPLVTYYEPASGVRVELSAVTFANWVDKTSNLLVDELLLEPGAVVGLDLARTSPGHWMTACWQVACWQLGMLITIGDGERPDLVVTGPEPGPLAPGIDTLVCSLHPLGLGLASVPPGALDYATEVRGQPDTFTAGPVSGLAPAWADEERQVTQTELIEGLDGLDSGPQRRLVRPSGPWTTAHEGILTALATGGSYVVVAGDVPAAELERIIETENAIR